MPEIVESRLRIVAAYAVGVVAAFWMRAHQLGNLLDNEPKSAYHPVACVACTKLHFVINFSGTLLGEK